MLGGFLFLLLCSAAANGFLFSESKYDKSCPPQETIFPCKCEPGEYANLKCSKLYDANTLLQVFENSSGRQFRDVSISDSSLQYIPAQIFEEIKFENLNLQEVTLVSAFDVQPERLTYLKELEMIYVKVLREWSWKKMAPMTELHRLAFYSSPIKTISNDFNKYVSRKLKFLEVTDSRTKKIGSQAFADLTELKYLGLMQNEITTLERSMLPLPSKLESLMLAFNKIQYLSRDMFTKMPNLRKVRLDFNLISTMPKDPFRLLLAITETLRINDNPIKCDCTLSWIPDAKKPKILTGRCSSPKSLYDKDLRDLTSDDFNCT